MEYPSSSLPNHGLIVYTGRFSCCSTTTYLGFLGNHLFYVYPQIPSVLPDRGLQVQAWRPSFPGHIIAYDGQILYIAVDLITHSTTSTGHLVWLGIYYESILQLEVRLDQT